MTDDGTPAAIGHSGENVVCLVGTCNLAILLNGNKQIVNVIIVNRTKQSRWWLTFHTINIIFCLPSDSDFVLQFTGTGQIC